MSYEYAKNEQVEEYMRIIKDNDLTDYMVSVSTLRSWTTTRIECEVEYLKEVALQKEALAAAYFNEF